MIPKIIHYCWFGHNELPPLAQKCIASWRMYFLGYEIKKWDEDNFNVNQIPYTQQAYRCKKFAFVSDYARIKGLYEKGGVYLDTDIEIVRRFDELLSDRDMVLGFESDRSLETAFMAAVPENELIDGFLKTYEKRKFINGDGSYDMSVINEHFSSFMSQNTDIDLDDERLREFEEGKIVVYPRDYFAAFDISNWHIKPTENTYTIHHMNASWSSKKKKLYFSTIKALQRILGIKGYDKLKGAYDKLKKKG